MSGNAYCFGIGSGGVLCGLFSLSCHLVYPACHRFHTHYPWHHICHRIRFQRDVFQKSWVIDPFTKGEKLWPLYLFFQIGHRFTSDWQACSSCSWWMTAWQPFQIRTAPIFALFESTMAYSDLQQRDFRECDFFQKKWRFDIKVLAFDIARKKEITVWFYTVKRRKSWYKHTANQSKYGRPNAGGKRSTRKTVSAQFRAPQRNFRECDFFKKMTIWHKSLSFWHCKTKEITV